MNKVYRGYRYRFYPTQEQKQQFAQTFGCVRYVYNYFLKVRTDAWYENNERVGYNDTAKLLTQLKQQPDTEWLKEVSNVCLQQSLLNLDSAFKNFFQGRSKYPVFKKKHGKKSARYTSSGFTFHDGQIKLAKQDQTLNINWSKPINGRVINCTVSLDASNRYHISFMVEEEVNALTPVQNEIGLDLGLTHAVITSDGIKVNNQKYYQKQEKRLAKAQRNLSRKKKFSKNRDKARLKVARIYAKISDQRIDFAHKLTTKLINENQVIAAESLQVKNLIKNRSLAKAIQDVGWYQIISMLEYKANWYGRSFIQIDKFYPSSKRCHACGHILEKLTLSVRLWCCPSCGSHHDRDVNAAKNILKAGKTILYGGELLRVHDKNTVGHTEI